MRISWKKDSKDLDHNGNNKRNIHTDDYNEKKKVRSAPNTYIDSVDLEKTLDRLPRKETRETRENPLEHNFFNQSHKKSEQKLRYCSEKASKER